MRIIQVHKHHHIIGGAERYYFELSNLLKNRGHQIAHFSMQSSQNLRTKWEKHFISNVNFTNKKRISAKVKMFGRALYSIEAKRKMTQLMYSFKPDLVHIHGIYYHLSPSFLPILKKNNIPIIATVHDYNLISPNVNLYHDGKICEITKGKRFYKAIFHKCVEESFLASFATAISLQIQDIFGLYEKNIDYYITPSQFMKSKLVDNGFIKNKIIHIPNFVHISKKATKKPGKYILFLGRFLKHKGIYLLINAAQKHTDKKFKLVGDGKEKETIKRIIKKRKIKNIKILEQKKQGELKKLIKNALFSVIPSLWYENQPYAILESFSFGKPVIASKIGGIPEIVKNGKNGILFEAGNIDELVQKIELLWINRNLVKEMGINATRKAREMHDPQEHYRSILNVYQTATHNKLL